MFCGHSVVLVISGGETRWGKCGQTWSRARGRAYDQNCSSNSTAWVSTSQTQANVVDSELVETVQERGAKDISSSRTWPNNQIPRITMEIRRSSWWISWPKSEYSVEHRTGWCINNRRYKYSRKYHCRTFSIEILSPNGLYINIILTLSGTDYIICRGPSEKWKWGASCSKIKNFKMAIAEH